MMQDQRFDVTLLQVGRKYPFLQAAGEGIRLEYQEACGLALYFILPDWNPWELRQIQVDKPIQFRWVVTNGIGFLCVKFGDMEWADCPFHPAIYKAHGIDLTLPQILPGQGLSLNIAAADSTDGTLKYLRLIGLGHKFSKEFASWCNHTAEENLQPQSYLERVTNVYQCYTTKQLVKMAICEYTIQPCNSHT